MPSPKFWMKCLRSVKGSIPSHVMPSLPMAQIPARCPKRSSENNVVMPWHPMPAPYKLPSGTFVPQLCGQPEQNHGVRDTASAIRSRGAAGRGARRSSPRWAAKRRRKGTRIASASRCPERANSDDPSRSVLPTMLGRSDEPHSASFTIHSSIGFLSSTTITSERPWQNCRTTVCSSG